MPVESLSTIDDVNSTLYQALLQLRAKHFPIATFKIDYDNYVFSITDEALQQVQSEKDLRVFWQKIEE